MSSPSALPLFVGVGTSGRRALKLFIKKGLKAEYAVISNNNRDRLDGVKFLNFKEDVRLGVYEVAIVISSLAGNTGPYVSHHVARSLKEEGNFVISVAYPPFPFEDGKKFKASSALRRLSNFSDMVFLINNDFYLKKIGRLPMDDFYLEVNEELAAVMNFLVNDVGALDTVRAMGKGIAVVSANMGNDLTTNLSKVVMKALTISNGFDSHLSFVSGKPSPKDLEKTYKALSLIEGVKEVRAEKGPGSVAMVTLLNEVELMKYDPVAEILGDRVLDMEPEVRLQISLPLDRID